MLGSVPMLSPRPSCVRCRKALTTCYCAEIEPVDSESLFVLLQHPKETRNRIGTARLAHLALPNSRLLVGIDFSADERVNAILADPFFYPVILYPGPDSRCVDPETPTATWVPAGKRLVVFVIDGTWAGARPILRRSLNLAALPRISFRSDGLSEYGRVRKQPRDYCLSTVEAIERLLRAIEPGVDGGRLLRPFRYMVRQQLEFEQGDKTRDEGVR